MKGQVGVPKLTEGQIHQALWSFRPDTGPELLDVPLEWAFHVQLSLPIRLTVLSFLLHVLPKTSQCGPKDEDLPGGEAGMEAEKGQRQERDC